jgi:hypothetical protein
VLPDFIPPWKQALAAVVWRELTPRQAPVNALYARPEIFPALFLVFAYNAFKDGFRRIPQAFVRLATQENIRSKEAAAVPIALQDFGSRSKQPLRATAAKVVDILLQVQPAV